MSEGAIAAEPEKKSRFTLPSAYTILFALIVLVAIATWIDPGRRLQPERQRRADSRDVSRGGVAAGAHPEGFADGADQRPVRDRGREGEHQLLQLGVAVRRDRHRAVHPRDRRVPRGDDEDRGDPGRHRQPRRADAGPGAVDDPGADERLRARRHELRDGGGEPRLLRARDHRDDRRGLRRAHRCRDRPPRVRDRRARVDRQPVRDRDRVRDRRHPDQRGHRRATGDPDRRLGDRDLLRPALRRPSQEGPVEVARLRPEGRERGALPGRQRRRCGHADGHAEGGPGAVRARLRGDDLWRRPLVGHRHPASPPGGGGSRR